MIATSYDDSLAFVRRYRSTIARIARKQGECADDLAQEIHIFYPIWMRNYNPKRGAVRTRVFNKLAWHLRDRRRIEFRHVTCELSDEIQQPAAADLGDEETGIDLREAPLPLGLPALVRKTLAAASGCQTTKDLAERLGITDRGARKRIARAEKLATVREPVQLDLFLSFESLDFEGVF